MKKVIWKYPIKITETQEIQVPVGSEFLSLMSQNDSICLWYIVNPNEVKKETLEIRVYGTNHPIYDSPDMALVYLGSCQIYGGALVWHVFVEENGTN